MPEPGKAMTPIGSASSSWSLRLKGAALRCAGPVGLEDDLRDLAIVGPAGGDALGAARAAAVQQHHVGMLGADLVERVPDALVIVAVGAAGEGDAGAGGGEHLGVGAAAGGEEVAAVDHRGGERAVVDHRAGARAPGGAGRGLEQLGGVVAEELEGVAALDEADALGRSGARARPT